MNFGFIKVAAATPEIHVADCVFNIQQIESLIHEAAAQQVEIICFPELCITAYTCGDLFFQQTLQEAAEKALETLLENTKSTTLLAIVGMPVRNGAQLFNAAVVFQQGKILAVVPKSFLPNSNEFYEKRWFQSAPEALRNTVALCRQEIPFGTDILFQNNDVFVGIEICEDLWTPAPPSSRHAQHGANLLFNLSASNELVAKNNYRRSLVLQQSARCVAGYIYSGAGFGESTTDVVFAGNGFIAENGALLAESNRFLRKNNLLTSEIDIELLSSERKKHTGFEKSGSTTYRIIPFALKNEHIEISRKIEAFPFVGSPGQIDERCEEVFAIQTAALAKRIIHTGCKRVVIGVSGGLDSTLALLVCAKTFDMLSIPRLQIVGVSMPGFGTTQRTRHNAELLMNALGVEVRTIPIEKSCLQHFQDIGHDATTHDVVYENTQARERTQILMDIANAENGLVIGTGDLSEMALGWATYGGDHLSMYAVNASIPKTFIRHLIHRIAEQQGEQSVKTTLLDILDTPVSPELLPAGNDGEISQKTEDLVGPYELHDFFLYYTVRYGFRPSKLLFMAQRAFQGKYEKAIVKKWMLVFFKRFFSQQFKRSCFPDGPKVGSVSLSPRGDWRMPSDAGSRLWLDEIEKL